MNPITRRNLGIFALLALVMATTRLHHFGALPDASWAVFFAGGFYLRGATRWAFPTLHALAVLVDYLVISGQGQDFWSHYCVSPAYWLLVPAHFAMWFGGHWLRSQYNGPGLREAGWFALTALLAINACYVISNGSFYWLSAAVAEPSMAGWARNLGDWFAPYLRVNAVYLGLGAALHVLAVALARTLGAAGADKRASL
jgi:hypothetical protein